jgi:hypothetical protein
VLLELDELARVRDARDLTLGSEVLRSEDDLLPALLALLRPLLPRLVDVLEGLEGQHRGRDLPRLAVPDQLDLALVQDEAVTVG